VNGPTYVALALWLNGPPCKWSGGEWSLSLTEQVIRLKEMIESSTMERRRAAAMPPAPQYSYTTSLVEPFIREIRQRQQQEQEQEEQRICDDVEESDSEEDDMIDCDCRRVERVPPFKRQKLQ